MTQLLIVWIYKYVKIKRLILKVFGVGWSKEWKQEREKVDL